MNPAATQHALALYTSVRQETTPEALHAFADQDLITFVATTRLPWSVCSRLTQLARCRYWWARYMQAKKIALARREHRRMDSHVRYFDAMQRRLDALRQPYTQQGRERKEQGSAP